MQTAEWRCLKQSCFAFEPHSRMMHSSDVAEAEAIALFVNGTGDCCTALNKFCNMPRVCLHGLQMLSQLDL